MLTFRRNSALTALLVPALLTVTAAPIRPWTTASPVDCTWETQGEHNILLPAVALVAPKQRECTTNTYLPQKGADSTADKGQPQTGHMEGVSWDVS